MTDTEEAIAGMEPVAARLGQLCDSLGEAGVVSIAHSLKRIADAWGKGPPMEPSLCKHEIDWMECKQCAPF